MAAPTKSLRLPSGLRGEIDRLARRSRRSFSAVTQDLLEEALRMRACPGIYFADEPAGREAKVAGTGLGVWEVIRDYLNANKNVATVRKSLPQLSDTQIKACLLYYTRYRDEIDREIAENAELVPEVTPPKRRATRRE